MSFDVRTLRRLANIEARRHSTSVAVMTNIARSDCTCYDREGSRLSGSQVLTNLPIRRFVSKTACDFLSSLDHYQDRSLGDEYRDILTSLSPTKPSDSLPRNRSFRDCQSRARAFLLPLLIFQAAPACSRQEDRDPIPSPPYRRDRFWFFPP